MTPVPAPVLDAMREWLNRAGEHGFAAEATAVEIIDEIDCAYPGGVAAFLRDHGNEGAGQ